MGRFSLKKCWHTKCYFLAGNEVLFLTRSCKKQQILKISSPSDLPSLSVCVNSALNTEYILKKHKSLSSYKEETKALEDLRTVQNGFLPLSKIIFQSLPGKEPKEENLPKISIFKKYEHVD